MKLYLVRHGQPNSEAVDSERGLSPAGEQEIALLASSFKSQGIVVGEIWHSEKTRANQTAQIISAALKNPNGVMQKKGLNPTDRVEPVVGQILAAQADLILVSHAPFLPHLASLLLTGDEFKLSLEFPTGGAACLDYAAGRWTLNWFAGPLLFRKGDGTEIYSYH